MKRKPRKETTKDRIERLEYSLALAHHEINKLRTRIAVIEGRARAQVYYQTTYPPMITEDFLPCDCACNQM